MNVLFVNQEASGWLPGDDDVEKCESLLEEVTQQKTIFLPPGCSAQIQIIGGVSFFVITQDPRTATVTSAQQKEIIERIEKKTGRKVLFLLPGCSLKYFEFSE